MLKKAGIIVAAAAAGLLTVSPLAFAGEAGGHSHHGSGSGYDHSPSCSFGASNDNSSEQSGIGYTALLGALGTVTNAAAPINAQTQAPVASCNNLEDIANITVKDNFQDNSKSSSDTKTVVKDSGNTTRGHH